MMAYILCIDSRCGWWVFRLRVYMISEHLVWPRWCGLVCEWLGLGMTTADVCLLEFSLPPILCNITCIHPHTCLHGDHSPFGDIHTSPLGLLLIWTFVLSIRRYWAGLAGDISGWGWHEQKLVIQSGQEQLSYTQRSSRSYRRQS